MRVLWVTEEPPDRNGGGGNIRQFHLVRGLAGRVDLDLLLCGTLPDDDGGLRDALGRVVEIEHPGFDPEPTTRLGQRVHDLRVAALARESFEIRVSRRYRAALEPALRALVAEGRYDVVHLEHAALAPLEPRRLGVRSTLTMQNLASVRSAQLAAAAGHWRHRWMWEADARRSRRLEAWTLGAYDRVAVVSAEDQALLPGPAALVPNGVDLESFPATPVPDVPRVVLTASLNYEPNIDGARWMVEEVLPRVVAEVPDVLLEIVGRRPDDRVVALVDHPNVRASFDVPSVLPHLQQAMVAVVPLRSGSGTRLKALEAMAAGRPLVGTTIGLEGVGLEDGRSAVIADDPATFAAGVVGLLRDRSRAAALAGAARAVAERSGWDGIVSTFLDDVVRG